MHLQKRIKREKVQSIIYNYLDIFYIMASTNTSILDNIQGLQDMEQKIFSTLEKNVNNDKFTSQDKNSLVAQINRLSDARMNLYSTVGDINQYQQDNLINSNKTLNDQTIAIEIVESELNKAKARLQLLEQEKINKLRIVQINTYYTERYNEHTSLMKLILYIFIPMLILALLSNKGFINKSIYYALMVLIGFVGIIALFWKFMYIISRDNMNYQEINWYFDKDSAPGAGESGGDPWETGEIVCVGQECCYEGSTYDPSTNICVPNSVLGIEEFGPMNDMKNHYKKYEKFTNPKSEDEMLDTAFTKYAVGSSYGGAKPDANLGFDKY